MHPVNGDVKVDVFDALLTLQYALNLIPHNVANDANKYPPAQPGVLRLLPPQRGLTAIGESQNPRTINVG